MTRRDVRRLAAIDMHGMAGSPRRAKIIRAEFYVGAFGCAFLGGMSLIIGEGWAKILGLWRIGIAVNYVALVWVAISLSGPGALEAELAGSDLHT